MFIKKCRRLLAGAVAFAMIFSVSVHASEAGTPAVSSETTVPETTAPETTAPETTAPETTAPETTAPETTAPETQESETGGETEPETMESEPEETESEVLIDVEGDKVTDIDKETEDTKETEKEAETTAESEIEKLMVTPEEIGESFRFETIEKVYAVAKKDMSIFTEKDKQSKKAGKISKSGVLYILLTEDKWCYVESGEVRGFVLKKYLQTGKDAESYVKQVKEENMETAKALIDRLENPALTYTKTTTLKTVVKKVYAVTNTSDVNVREEDSTDSRIIGTLPENGLCYVLADAKKEWIYIESGDVRGFVKKDYLTTGKKAKKIVKKNGAKNMKIADEVIEPEDNRSLYYTLTSVKEPFGERGKYLGKFKLTAYCACPICCGAYSNGITASGTKATQGRTIAMGGVPFGTRMIVGDVIYTLEDRGTPYGHIDIYMVNHSEAAAFGVQEAEVYLAKD